MESILINSSTIKAIEAVLSKGDRVEVIPVKDGVKVMSVKRMEVKTDGRETAKNNR